LGGERPEKHTQMKLSEKNHRTGELGKQTRAGAKRKEKVSDQLEAKTRKSGSSL